MNYAYACLLSHRSRPSAQRPLGPIQQSQRLHHLCSSRHRTLTVVPGSTGCILKGGGGSLCAQNMLKISELIPGCARKACRHLQCPCLMRLCILCVVLDCFFKGEVFFSLAKPPQERHMTPRMQSLPIAAASHAGMLSVPGAYKD